MMPGQSPKVGYDPIPAGVYTEHTGGYRVDKLSLKMCTQKTKSQAQKLIWG